MIGTSLLEPGHWHSTFFPKGFWQQNAFPEYGADPEPEPAVALTGFNRVSISILLFDEPDGTLLADLTERVEIPTDPSTFEHGFEGVGVFVPMTEVESSYFYETALNSWLLICAGPEVIFEGRAQDVKKTTAGLDIVALGSWVATSHSTHTSFWSSTDVSLWRVVTSNDRTNRFDKKYDFDTEGRLFVSLQKDAVYEHSEMGTLAYLAPHNGSQLVKTITCNYAFNLPTGLTARIVSFDDEFANGLQEWGIVGNGTYQSGSINLTLPNEKQIITMEIRPTAQYTYTGEAGDTYFQLTSVRLMGAAAAPVTADLVVKHLVAEMSALNPGELSSDTSLIEATSSDMWNKEYQDLLIGEILSPLIYYGDQQDPPNVYEIGVYENQQLYYRPRGSNGRTWHVDVPEKELSKTISTMYNEAYATHGSGDLKRTAVAQIDASVDKYGLKRRVFVSTTTSQANAERRRDTTLEEFQIATPQGDVVIERLQDESGTAYPIWMIRAGDTIHIRNTSITDGDEIDRTSTFTVKRVAYQLLANTVSVTPESDLPYIEYLAPKF